MTKKLLILLSICVGLFVGFKALSEKNSISNQVSVMPPKPIGTIISGKFDPAQFKSDVEWKKILTPEQYHIMRESGTEVPFTGKLNKEKREGVYYSIGCKSAVFSSKQKYDSGTGWPSFWAPVNSDAVVLRRETAPGDDRIEVLDVCGNHLGHVFDDGPAPTEKRYCINSAALEFVPATYEIN